MSMTTSNTYLEPACQRWGIPSRIERRLDTPDATSRVLTVIPVSSPASGEDLKAPTAVSEQQFERWQKQGYADFIWVQ